MHKSKTSEDVSSNSSVASPWLVESRRLFLEQWYQSRSGRRLRAQITKDLRAVLGKWFGYHIVTLGVDAGISVCEITRIRHTINIVPNDDVCGRGGTDVVALDAELPLATESVDVIVLINAFELTSVPHELLREVQRALTPNGHVLVVGSNPFSLRGLWCWFLRLLGCTHCAQSMGPSAKKLEDWLNLLGFSVAPPRYKLVLPISGCGRLGRWLVKLDNWLVGHNIPLGSSYIVYGGKMVRGDIQTPELSVETHSMLASNS